MKNKTIRIKVPEAQLDAMRAFLESGTVERAAKAGLLSAAFRGRVRAVWYTGRRHKVDTGRFRNAWKASPLKNGAMLSNDTPYAAVIEAGRRPGARMPPLGPIEAWARRKKISIPPIVIARAIAARGIPGAFIFRDTMKVMPKFIDDEVRREVKGAFRTFLLGPAFGSGGTP
jgi:hypothetical protein